MYPTRELNRLADKKRSIRKVIAHRRVECARAALHVASPLGWLDRMLSLIRQLVPYAPLAALPLGLLLRRHFLPRSGFLSLLLRWVPLTLGISRALRSAIQRPIGRIKQTNLS